MKKKLSFIILAFICINSFGQVAPYWKAISNTEAFNLINGKELFTSFFKPSSYDLFTLNETLFRTLMINAPHEKNVSVSKSNFIISIPVGQDKIEQFKLVEAPVMQPELAAKYPNIKSYAGQGIQTPGYTIRCDITPLGFHGMIVSASGSTVYINPVNTDAHLYAVYARDKNDKRELKFNCETQTNLIEQVTNKAQAVPHGNIDDGTLRTYRLALCSTGEFSRFYITGNEKTTADSIATVLAALNTLLTRNNELYERDLSVRLLFVNDEDNIIFLDPKTDGFTTSNLNSQCQVTCDSIIENENYDIGHVLHKAADNGNAGCVGCVCKTGIKGSGATSYSNPALVDYLVIDFWSHEMGHQFGANHTFSKGGQTDAPEGTPVQVEPGSGSTIMGYAGITGQYDIQDHSDDYFHSVSLAQISNYIKSQSGGGKCTVSSSTGNTAPVCNAGGDYTIPVLTPFALTGNASDNDAADVLTYTWEETDNTTADYSGFPEENTTSTTGALFRSIKYSVNNTRYLPAVETILTGATSNKWEALPVVSRDLNFRFTVRDNHAGDGNNNSDDMLIQVSDAAGPFIVTTPINTASWVEGDNVTVTWDVANTTAAPVNCNNVNILLSIDGGLTFPYTLSANTSNDGSEQMIVPFIDASTTQARVKVEAVENIFFNISNADFKVQKSTSVVWLTITAEKSGNKDVLIKWSTASEINNNHFEVERSRDQTNFTKIGSVPAGASPTQVQEYIFTDNSPLEGENFYRIKQVSADEKFTYSPLAQIVIGTSWSLQPNPATNNVNVSFTQNTNNVQIALINTSGRIVYQKIQSTVNANESIFIPVNNIASGVYFLKVTTITESKTKKLIVSH